MSWLTCMVVVNQAGVINMKKLLLILFSLMLSFNSYGGSIDGKGLKCEDVSGRNSQPIYMWFSDGFFQIPTIQGSKIIWKRFLYTEDGTRYIQFDKEKRFFPFEHPFQYLKSASVNRKNLMLLLGSFRGNSWYECSVQYSKQWIISDLRDIITSNSSTNKI